MDLTHLSDDDTVILTNQHVILNGVRHEAVLTERHLILVDADTAAVHENIPLNDILHADTGENILHEPVITLTVNTPSGETRSVGLIFARTYADQNIQNRDRWIEALKKAGTETSEKLITTAKGTLKEKSAGISGEQANPQRGGDWMPSLLPRKATQLPPEKEPTKRTPIHSIALMAALIIVIIVGAFIYGQFLVAHMPPTEEELAISTTAIPTFTPSLTLPPTPTPVVTLTPQIPTGPVIPGTGVWALIRYSGNFTGTIGSQGNYFQVNTSGDQFYPIPVNSGVVDGSIDKQDGNGANMSVEIYQDGALVSMSSTTTPYGEIIINTQLTGSEATGPGIVQSPGVEVAPTLEALLPPEQIPPTGTWFRVQYPGNYTGYVGVGGITQEINSTGNTLFQIFQVPVSGGIIDGSVEKQDGSAGNLIVELYKDGALIAQTNTTTPRGVVNLHLPL